MDIYNQLEDKEIVHRINKRFYREVYQHPWLSKFFQQIAEEHITNQQTDFMTGALGGPKLFCGRHPTRAHPHIFVTDEVFELRRKLLEEAFEAESAPEELRVAWVRIDAAFRRAIVKDSLEDCSPRWTNDPILHFPK